MEFPFNYVSPQVNVPRRSMFLLPLWSKGTPRRRCCFRRQGVDVKAVGEMRRPVDLKEMKQHFKDFVLFKQPRLSVVPVPELIWKNICDLGAGYHGDDDDDDDDEHSRPID